MARNKLGSLIKLIDIEVNNSEPEKAFLADLKHSIELTDKKDFVKGSNFYKPSSMGCIRQMYYTRIDAPADEHTGSYSLIGICNNGTDTHVRIQTYISRMKENGIDCEYIDVAEFVNSRELYDVEVVNKSGMETKLFHRTLKLSFLCDGIIKYRGVYYILELKTEGSGKFFNRQGVNPDHYNQATCYSIALGLDNVLFVYISRDTYDMKSYMFNVTDEMKQSVTGMILNCENYVQEKKTPPKPVVPNKKACMYCQFKTQCGKD